MQVHLLDLFIHKSSECFTGQTRFEKSQSSEWVSIKYKIKESKLHTSSIQWPRRSTSISTEKTGDTARKYQIRVRMNPKLGEVWPGNMSRSKPASSACNLGAVLCCLCSAVPGRTFSRGDCCWPFVPVRQGLLKLPPLSDKTGVT